jgi:hypothetical protein
MDTSNMHITARLIVAVSFVLIIAFALTAQPTGAAGQFNLILMESEGLSFQVFDSRFLDFYAFSDFSQGQIAKPDNLDDSVMITRYIPVDEVYIQPFDRMIYYPSNDGSGGYVYYLGSTTGASQYDEQWYRGTPDAEVLIQSTFERQERDLTRLVYIAVAAFAGLILLVLRSVR